MSNHIPVTNHGKTALNVAGFTVLPGETRIFPAHHVPQNLRPQEAKAAPVPEPSPEQVAVDEILEHNVAQVTEMLPALSPDELDAIEQAELAGKNRKGLLAAITEDRLRRAAEDEGDGDPEMDAYVASLTEMDDAELAEQLELMEGQPAMIAAIEGVIEARAVGGDGQP